MKLPEYNAVEAEPPACASPPCCASAVMNALWKHAHERPDAIALAELDDAGSCCTYRELARLVELRTQHITHSIEPDGVLIAVLPSCGEYAAWFCASLMAGIRFLPMHPQIAGPEALAIAERLGAKAAIVSPGLAAERSLSHLAIGRPGRDWREGSTKAAGLPLCWSGSVVLASSGTTGVPKLVVRSSASLDACAQGLVRGMGLTAQDRVAFATSLSHSYGVDVLVSVILAGASLIVMSRFEAGLFARAIESEDAGGRRSQPSNRRDVGGEYDDRKAGSTVLAGVPFIFEALSRVPSRDSGRLRAAYSAGGPLSERVRERFSGVWGVEVGQIYGATELGSVAMNVPGTAGFDAGSIGTPLPGISMRVLDPEHPELEVPAGQEGHLAVRAPSMLCAYADADLELIDGHFFTGDLAKLDAQGRFWLTGRLKLLIDVGTYKVNPLEVERVLSAHPSVAECVVVPLPASETIHRIRAVVVPYGAVASVDAEALRQFIRERLSPVKVPRVVEFAASLPKSPTGKVLREQVAVTRYSRSCL